MTEDMENTSPQAAQSWSETWIKAVTQPSEEAYQEIINDPGASTKKANLWVFLAALAGAVISSLLGSMFGSSLLGGQAGVGFAGLFGALICAGPIAGALAVLGLAISSGIIQLIANALGGEGTRQQLVYGMAAFLAPISLVSTVISGIPLLRILSFLLSIYGMVLTVIAVKAVNKLDWGKSVVASLGLLLVIVLIAGFVIMVLALLGPAIGNVYNNL